MFLVLDTIGWVNLTNRDSQIRNLWKLNMRLDERTFEGAKNLG